MAKDFNSWNKEKINLEHEKPDSLSFHEREVWWCSIGLNLGDEQDGKNDFFERPILVVKKFNRKLARVLPMSTKLKEGIYYHQVIYDNHAFVVILSQLRLISVKRFRRFIRKISSSQFSVIQDKLIALLKN